MDTFPINNLEKVKKAIPLIESRLKVRISLNKEMISLKGNEVACFSAGEILQAVDFGFDARDALLLLKDDYCLEFINIKNNTPKKNLKEVRGRVIGTEGKAKKAIEELTGGCVVIQGNEIGLIVDSEHLDAAVQGILSLIRGAKHSNVFSYIEKQNAKLRMIDRGDLGLK